MLRDFTAGTGVTRVPGKDFEDDPLVAVLFAHVSGPEAEIQAGQAMQRVLLTATAEGLATSFLSHVAEVPLAREELRSLVGATRPPQVVLRVGHGWPVPATPRRSAADLLEPEPHLTGCVASARIGPSTLSERPPSAHRRGSDKWNGDSTQ